MDNIKQKHDLWCICNRVNDCISVVKKCSKLINDNRRRRTTKVGQNQATPWEIAAVMSIREGKTVYKNTIFKKDFTTEVKPDGSIIVIEKNGKGKWYATGQEIDNYELRTEGRVSRLSSPQYSNPIPNVSNQATNTSANNQYSQYYQQQYAVSQDDAKLVKIIAQLGKIVGMIAAISATIAMIKVGPAVDNLKSMNNALIQFSKYVQGLIKKIQKIRDLKKGKN